MEPPCGRASRLQRCSGSAATKQDLCKTDIAASKVNWTETLDCVPRRDSRASVSTETSAAPVCFGVWGLEFAVCGADVRVQGLGLDVLGVGFMVWGLGGGV